MGEKKLFHLTCSGNKKACHFPRHSPAFLLPFLYPTALMLANYNVNLADLILFNFCGSKDTSVYRWEPELYFTPDSPWVRSEVKNQGAHLVFPLTWNLLRVGQNQVGWKLGKDTALGGPCRDKQHSEKCEVKRLCSGKRINWWPNLRIPVESQDALISLNRIGTLQIDLERFGNIHRFGKTEL